MNPQMNSPYGQPQQQQPPSVGNQQWPPNVMSEEFIEISLFIVNFF